MPGVDPTLDAAALTLISDSPEATARAAGRLAALLRDGDVLCLYGDLGAGKTTFTRGLVAALGAPAALVSSPTFTLLHEYRGGGRLTVFHGDAYRLAGAGDAEDAGFGEALSAGEGVVVLEWPERVAGILPEERLDIHLEETGPEARTLHFLPRGPRWMGFAAAWEGGNAA
jgi:ATPase, YjeE family